MLNKNNHKYNYEESFVHYINPIIKIISFFVFIIIMLLKFNNILFICNISFVLILILFSNINILKYLKVIWNIKFIIIFLYIFLYYKNFSLMKINYINLYLVFSILFIYVIMFTTPKEDLSNSLGSIFNLGVYKERIKMSFYKLIVFKEIFLNNADKRINQIEYNGFDIRYRSFIVRWGLALSNIKVIYQDSKKDFVKLKKNIKYRGYNGRDKKYNYSRKLKYYDYLILLYDILMIVYYIMVVK